MKIAHKDQAKEHKNSEKCVALEYPIGDKNIDGAVITIKGRYPDKGRVINEECKELAYVISGSGKVVVEDEEVILSEGSLVLVEPKERYFWEGNLVLFISSNPAWYPEQHKEVE